MIDATTESELREIAGRYPVARSGLLPMLHLHLTYQLHTTLVFIANTFSVV